MKLRKLIALALGTACGMAFLTGCAAGFFEEEIHVVFMNEGAIVDSGTITQFKNYKTPTISDAYIPTDFRFLGWTTYEVNELDYTSPTNFKSQYIGAGRMIHYMEAKPYAVNSTVTYKALIMHKDDIPREYHFYGVLQLCYLATHQDFRFMLVSASPLQPRFLVTWLIYLPGFFIFYISNSLRVNLGISREGFKEWKVVLISALANSLGLVFMIIINYFVYFKTGTVYYGYYSATDTNEMWLYINMVFPLIVMMALLPIFNRISYKQFGNVYAGALLWCMIFIMMSLSASISFIPM